MLDKEVLLTQEEQEEEGEHAVEDLWNASTQELEMQHSQEDADPRAGEDDSDTAILESTMPSQDMPLTQDEPEEADSREEADEPEDSLPTQDEPLTQEEQEEEEEDDGLDDFGLPEARERASPEEAVRDPYAVVDHLSAAQCAGMNGYNFYECQRIFNSCQEN